MDPKQKKYPMPQSVRKSAEFRHISRLGKRFRGGFIRLDVIRNNSDIPDEISRLGIIIPEKSIKKSVHRNRVRRMIKEACRHWWEFIKPGLDIAFMVKSVPNHDHAGYVEMKSLELFLKAEVLVPDGVKPAKQRISELKVKFSANSK